MKPITINYNSIIVSLSALFSQLIVGGRWDFTVGMLLGTWMLAVILCAKCKTKKPEVEKPHKGDGWIIQRALAHAEKLSNCDHRYPMEDALLALADEVNRLRAMLESQIEETRIAAGESRAARKEP